MIYHAEVFGNEVITSSQYYFASREVAMESFSMTFYKRGQISWRLERNGTQTAVLALTAGGKVDVGLIRPISENLIRSRPEHF